MKIKQLVAAIGLSTLSFSLYANLAQVGPVGAESYGYPAWYQDENGVALDLCFPDAADTDGAQKTACLLEIDPPYAFPTHFPDESFYNRVVSERMPLGAVAGAGDAILVLAVEAAFLNGAPVANEQVVFTRIRVIIDAPADGTYTVYHPYGIETFPDVQTGPRAVTFTEDVGLAALDFTGALTSRVGPFLMPSATPGGIPNAPTVLNGADFISDGVTLESITGSPFNQNYFMVCAKDANDNPIVLGNAGPNNNCARTDLFTLTGRLHDNVAQPISAAPIQAGATYKRDTSGNVQFDTSAHWFNPLNLPQPPILTIALENGSGGKRMQYANDKFFAQLRASGIDTQAVNRIALVVDDNTANPPLAQWIRPKDIIECHATYNFNSHVLNVTATTSDKFYPGPVLNLVEYPDASHTQLPADLSTWTFTKNTPLPDNEVTVIDTTGALCKAQVIKGSDGTTLPDSIPVAIDDNANVAASGAAIEIAVTTNDMATPAITANSLVITRQPRLGQATLLAGNIIQYTPRAAIGNDTIKYTVRNANGESNEAKVDIIIEEPAAGFTPIATADTASLLARASLSIDVLNNDLGNGGTLDPATLAIVGSATGGTAVVNPTTHKVDFTAGATAGTFGFDYRVANTNGNSATARVTVTVIPGETLTVARARCRNGVWRVNGTTSTTTGNPTITLYTTATVPTSPTTANTLGTAPVLADRTWDSGNITKGTTCPTRMSIKSALGTTLPNITVTR